MLFIKTIKLFIRDILFCNYNKSNQINTIEYDDIPECPICFKDTTNSMVTFLKCDHWACSDCIHKLSKLPICRRRCHMCRKKFKTYPRFGEI
jgi:hypothetical protein